MKMIKRPDGKFLARATRVIDLDTPHRCEWTRHPDYAAQMKDHIAMAIQDIMSKAPHGQFTILIDVPK